MTIFCGNDSPDLLINRLRSDTDWIKSKCEELEEKLRLIAKLLDAEFVHVEKHWEIQDNGGK